MYFQNPPTNFIDKFVLIINPLQMNVNFFLGHQCKILRLYRACAVHYNSDGAPHHICL